MDRYSWLERQLDRDDLTDEEFDKYNKEINDLQEKINSNLKNQRDAKEAKRLADIARIEQLWEEGKTNELVEEYGQQFIDEYTIMPNFTVISNASRERNPNQQNVWEHASHEAAVKKLHQLLYYRVYDHYVRAAPTR